MPNRGAVVRSLSPAEVRHIFDIRDALEGYAAQLAARRIDDGDNWGHLIAVLERGRAQRDRRVFPEFVLDNRAFHQEIVRICGNPPHE